MKRSNVFGALIVLALIAVLTLGGCSSLRSLMVGELTKGANESQAAAQPKAQASGSSGLPVGSAGWNQAMTMQARFVFSYAFGGMWTGQTLYKPGEYTKFRWEAKGEDPVTMERAFLKKLDDGKEWWRVAWADEDDSWVWEALLEPQTGKALRLRARDPDGQTGEVPVTGDTFYTPQAQLTKESVQAATVGTEKVQVPAGSFTAQHVVYTSTGAGGKMEWWAADGVPGGVVKYLVDDRQGGTPWTSLLAEYGKNAATILGSY